LASSRSSSRVGIVSGIGLCPYVDAETVNASL
jgi:hypothetical protein